MLRWPRYLLALALGCALLLGAGWLIERQLPDRLLRLFERHTQHPLQVHGPWQLHLLARHPLLRASDVEVGNPPWSAPGTLARIGQVTIRLAWQFGWPPLALQRVELDGADWHLQRDADNRANWTAQPARAGSGPPLLRSLSMPRAHVTLADERRHLSFEGMVSAGDAGDGAAPPLRVSAEGTLNGRAATLHIEGEPLATAQRSHPWHFKLEERSGGARLDAQGYFRTPFDFREIEGQFQASGPTLRDAYYLIGLKLPASGPFTAAGSLTRHDLFFSYHDLHLSSGGSDLAGTLDVDSASGQPRTTGELHSARLRLADLGTHEHAASQGIPDSPLPVAGLRKSEARVRYRAQALELGRESLSNVSLLLSTHAGTLRIEQVHAGLAGGELSGEAHLDAGHGEPAAGVDLHLRELHLEQLQPPGREPLASGTLDARARLESQGGTWHALAQGAHGEATLVVPAGSVRKALAEAASADVAGALGLLGHSERATPIRCAVASVAAEHGILSTRTLLVDTDATLLSGSGEIRLDSETVDMHLRGHPKHPTLALHSGLAITGPLKHPRVRLEKRGALLQGGAAVALGVLLTPLAAALAFVDPGLAHGADCSAVLEAARTEAHDPLLGTAAH